eukprot:EG_transcript_21210
MAAITLRQLADYHRRLWAARDAGDAVSVKATLTALYAYRPSMDDLAASRMGILVAQLAREPTCLPVQVHAQTLLARWMQFAVAEGLLPTPRQPGPAQRPPATCQGNTKSRRHHPYGNVRHRVRPHQAELPAVQLYDEADRNAMASRLLQALVGPLEPPVAGDPLRAAVGIEATLHDLFAAEHGAEQKLAKFHQIAANLRDNADLRRAVLSGRTTPQQLVHMHAWELGKWEARQEAHLKAQAQEVVVEEDVPVDSLGPPDLSRQ